MKRLVLYIALATLFSYFVMAACPGTDSQVSGTEIPQNDSATPTITHRCTSAVACSLTLANITIDSGTTILSNNFTGNTPCAEGTQVFSSFTIPWENVQGAENDRNIDAIIGGSSNDRIFTVGTIDNGVNGSDLFVQAYNKSTGVPIWRRVVSKAGTQNGIALDWDSSASILTVVGNDAATSEIQYYVFNQNGVETCNQLFGDSGVSTYNATDVYVGGGPIVFISGNINSTTAFAMTISGSFCGPSIVTTIDGTGTGHESLDRIDEDSSVNGDFVGVFRNASSNYALEIEFSLGMNTNHLNGINVGTSSSSNDTFYAVSVDEDDDSIIAAGRLNDIPSVCKFDSSGSPVWSGTCRQYHTDGNGQWESAKHYLGGVYLGGWVHNAGSFMGGANAMMARFNDATGSLVWAKENNGTTEPDMDTVKSVAVVSGVTPTQVIGVGLRDGNKWAALSRSTIDGTLQFGHEYQDGVSEANVIVSEPYNAFAFGNGTSVGMDYIPVATSATPEFSPTTLLIAVLVAGAFVMFVVRRKR